MHSAWPVGADDKLFSTEVSAAAWTSITRYKAELYRAACISTTVEAYRRFTKAQRTRPPVDYLLAYYM